MSFPNRPDFKIVILQDQKPRIPKKYVEIFWKGTPNPIILRLPNAVQQEIFWVEKNGDILLHKNWNSFAKYLKHGFVLTFKYIGGSHFKVKIFGLHGLEINYSHIKSVNEEVVEATKKAKELIEVSDESEDETEDEIEIPMQAKRTRNGKRKFKGKNRRDMVKKAKKSSTTATINVRDNDENPCFEVKMTKYYANGSFLWVPRKFSREHLNNFKGFVTLRFGKGIIMKVNLSFNDNNKKYVMNAGWKLFSKKCNLQVDDACKFVMTQHRPLLFTMIVTRARKGPSPKKLLGYKEGNTCDENIAKKKDIGETSKSRKRVHFFEDSDSNDDVMKPYTFKILMKRNNYPDLPKDFMNLGCDGKYVELKMGRQLWSVKVKYFDRIKVRRFGDGWRQFVKENNVEIGDTCLFKLIDEEKFVFEVSIVGENA